jgi:hypothetical protein
MDDSEYSDDDTIQELLLDAQPVVVEKRAVESTRTHYRAQKLVKNRGRKKTRDNDDEDDSDLEDERADTQNKKKKLKKGQYEGARKGQRREQR